MTEFETKQIEILERIAKAVERTALDAAWLKAREISKAKAWSKPDFVPSVPRIHERE